MPRPGDSASPCRHTSPDIGARAGRPEGRPRRAGPTSAGVRTISDREQLHAYTRPRFRNPSSADSYRLVAIALPDEGTVRSATNPSHARSSRIRRLRTPAGCDADRDPRCAAARDLSGLADAARDAPDVDRVDNVAEVQIAGGRRRKTRDRLTVASTLFSWGSGRDQSRTGPGPARTDRTEARTGTGQRRVEAASTDRRLESPPSRRS